MNLFLAAVGAVIQWTIITNVYSTSVDHENNGGRAR